MQATIQAIQLQYAAPQPSYQANGGHGHYGRKNGLEAAESVVTNINKIGKEVMEAVDTVVQNTTAEHMVGVPIKVPIVETLQRATIIMWSHYPESTT